jgi:hypothetical protein
LLAPRVTDRAVVQSVKDSVEGRPVKVVPFTFGVLTVTDTGLAADALHFAALPDSPGSFVAVSVYDTVVVLPTVVVSLPPTVTLFVTVSA